MRVYVDDHLVPVTYLGTEPHDRIMVSSVTDDPGVLAMFERASGFEARPYGVEEWWVSAIFPRARVRVEP